MGWLLPRPLHVRFALLYLTLLLCVLLRAFPPPLAKGERLKRSYLPPYFPPSHSILLAGNWWLWARGRFTDSQATIAELKKETKITKRMGRIMVWVMATWDEDGSTFTDSSDNIQTHFNAKMLLVGRIIKAPNRSLDPCKGTALNWQEVKNEKEKNAKPDRLYRQNVILRPTLSKDFVDWYARASRHQSGLARVYLQGWALAQSNACCRTMGGVQFKSRDHGWRGVTFANRLSA